MRMKEEALKGFVDFIIQERMQSAFSQMKAGKEPDDKDDVNKGMRKRWHCFPKG